MLESLLVLGTIDAALLAATAGAACWVWAAPSRGGRRGARLLWTAGCGLYLLHVAAAFHYEHGWSHAAAVRFTAERTRAVTGLDFAGGLYVNYVFTAGWIADTARLWLCRVSAGETCGWLTQDRSASWQLRTRLGSATRWLAIGWYGLFVFVAFNATAVFATGTVRWAGVGGLLLLGGLLAARRKAARTRADSPSR